MASTLHPPLLFLSSHVAAPVSAPIHTSSYYSAFLAPFSNQSTPPPPSRSAAIGLILQHGHVDNKDLSHSFKLNKNPARGANESRPPQSHGAGAGSGHGR
jgi:hypothetical protein